ncbi:phage portal protein [Nodosilinea nodulosa]|uniref:phage portal protein n=1 Tax=Nodosilinea nodulosa TaxID=416001 RepID=UPI000375922A|nr:phage portal protein [Nodosilinea nodulosa]
MPKSIKEIVEAALTKDGGNTSETMIVSNHLAQMVLFGIRKGVEFYPQIDVDDERQNFINGLIKRNRIDLYLQSIWELFVGTGAILFYLRPQGNTYDIHWYKKDQFFPYYKEGGRELEKVVITYSYKVQSNLTNLEQEKWVRLTITTDEIRQSEFENNPGLLDIHGVVGNENVCKNTLGIIPCVIIDNNPTALGQRGTNDFDWLGGQIEAHDKMAGAINKNIEFFGNPSLVTTRSHQEVTESVMDNRVPRTVSSGAAFTNQHVASTYKYDPSSLEASGSKIRKVIGNVEADERFGFIQPNAISGDQNRWAMQFSEMIRTAMGGVDELGISSGATAFEIKSLYGRAASTADRKSIALYDYGLCELFKLAIAAEEFLYERSFEAAIGWDVEKNGPISGQFINFYLDGGQDPKGKEIKPNPEPPGLVGLRPRGDRAVLWRYKGPVFEDGPIDLQQKSILARNLAEEGFDTISQMQILFPDKTEKEIDKMLGGVPFRRISNTLGIVQSSIGLIGQLSQTPDPLNPAMPLVARYGQFVDQMVFILFQKMLTELSRGQTNDRIVYDPEPSPFGATSGIPSDSGAGTGAGWLSPGPAGQLPYAVPYAGWGSINAPALPPGAPMAGPADQQRSPNVPTGAAGVAPGSPGYASGLLDPTLYGPAGFPNAVPANGQLQSAAPGAAPGPGQRWELFGAGSQQNVGPAGQPGTAPLPEFVRPIPSPGATVQSESARLAAIQQQQPWSANQQPVYGESDLARQPGLLAQLFPTFAAAAGAIKPASKRGAKNKR